MLGSVIDGRVALLWRLLVEAALLFTRRSVQSRGSTGRAKERCPEHASTHSVGCTRHISSGHEGRRGGGQPQNLQWKRCLGQGQVVVSGRKQGQVVENMPCWPTATTEIIGVGSWQKASTHASH